MAPRSKSFLNPVHDWRESRHPYRDWVQTGAVRGKIDQLGHARFQRASALPKNARNKEYG